MKNIYRDFQRRKAFISHGFLILAIVLFAASYLLRFTDEWLCNLLMGIGASCLASVLYSFVTSIPEHYRFLKKENDEKRAIIHGRWEAIDLARRMFHDCCKAGDYEGALRRINYLREKCGSLCDEFRDVQQNEKMLIDDASVQAYCDEFEKAQLEYLILCANIEADEEPLDPTNENFTEYLNRMKASVKRFFANYESIYAAQLHEAVDIERIKIDNRYI